MKKFLNYAVVTLCLLSLVGCTKKKSTKDTTASSTATSSLKQTSDTQSAPANKLWDSEKKQALQTFMDDWGKEMGQTYQAFEPNHNTDLYGLKLPDDILNQKNGVQMAVNQQPVSVAWSEDGEGTADYQLVAVYSDAESQDYMKKHIYFFTFHQGQAQVLITMQNQGNAENYLYFKETDNQSLKAGFANIVGQSVTTPAPSANSSIKDSKLLAAKVWLSYFSRNDNTNDVDARVQGLIENTYSINVESYQNYEIWSTGVTIPESVTILSGSPTAAGMVTYHNNGDGTVTIYPVPSHYQDHDWDDPVKGKEMANQVIQAATIHTIADIPDETAQKLADYLTGEVTQE